MEWTKKLDNKIEAPGLDELALVEEQIAAEEADLGLEWVGAGHGMNRKERRAKMRTLRRLTRRPDACQTLDHPLTRKRTPFGAKALAKRRAKNKISRQSRKRNRKSQQ